MTKLETMGEFFAKRADTYDRHMKEPGISSGQFYSHVSDGILNTQDKVRIMDIGCGTGLELEGIFERAPNAVLTGIDISGEMLNKLKVKYERHLSQITLVQKSYLTLPFGKEKYDYVVSVMTLHHLLPDKKQRLYRRIKKALKPNGKYIEGDYVVTPKKERQLLNDYYELCRSGKDLKNGSHHVDIPFSLDTQKRLLAEAGFSWVEVLWQQRETAVYVASL
jgi:tRNA (cmo5U34)-methyltransferase